MDSKVFARQDRCVPVQSLVMHHDLGSAQQGMQSSLSSDESACRDMFSEVTVRLCMSRHLSNWAAWELLASPRCLDSSSCVEGGLSEHVWLKAAAIGGDKMEKGGISDTALA